MFEIDKINSVEASVWNLPSEMTCALEFSLNDREIAGSPPCNCILFQPVICGLILGRFAKFGFTAVGLQQYFLICEAFTSRVVNEPITSTPKNNCSENRFQIISSGTDPCMGDASVLLHPYSLGVGRVSTDISAAFYLACEQALLRVPLRAREPVRRLRFAEYRSTLGQ